MSSSRRSSLYHVDCDVRHVEGADIATVGALALAALNARRAGRRLRVVNAPPELCGLIALAGLDDVLLGRSGGKPEEREEPLSVEERCEADDLPV